MTDIVNAKVVEEEPAVWPRYIVQFATTLPFAGNPWQHEQHDTIESADRFLKVIADGYNIARIIDTAPEPVIGWGPGPAMSPQVRELVEAAKQAMNNLPAGGVARQKLSTALKPFVEAK